MWEREEVREAVRKLVHIPGGLLPPVVLVLFGYRGSVALAAYLTAYLGLGGWLAVRWGRRFPIVWAGIASTRRRHEAFPTAAFQFLVAVLAVGLLFPVPIFLAAVALMAAGDGTAAVVGRRWGRRALPWNPRKTWEGLLAGILVGAPVAAAYAVLGDHLATPAGVPEGVWGAAPVAAVIVAGMVLVLGGAHLLVRWGVLARHANTRPVETVLLSAAAAVPALFVLRGPAGWSAAPVLDLPGGALLVAGLVLVVAPLALLAESRVNRHDNLLVPFVLAVGVWTLARLMVP